MAYDIFTGEKGRIHIKSDVFLAIENTAGSRKESRHTCMKWQLTATEFVLIFIINIILTVSGRQRFLNVINKSNGLSNNSFLF